MYLLNRCALFLVFFTLTCTTSLAVPPWKQAQRYERELMQAQLKFQQAANRNARDIYQYQKRLLRLDEKYRAQAYRYGVAPLVHYNVPPVPVRFCPTAPVVTQPVVVVPARRPTQPIYQITEPRIQQQIVERSNRPAPMAPLSTRVVIREQAPPVQVYNPVQATEVIRHQPLATTEGYIVEQPTTISTSPNATAATVALPTETTIITPSADTTVRTEILPEHLPTPIAIDASDVTTVSAEIDPDPQPTPAQRPTEP